MGESKRENVAIVIALTSHATAKLCLLAEYPIWHAQHVVLAVEPTVDDFVMRYAPYLGASLTITPQLILKDNLHQALTVTIPDGIPHDGRALHVAMSSMRGTTKSNVAQFIERATRAMEPGFKRTIPPRLVLVGTIQSVPVP